MRTAEELEKELLQKQAAAQKESDGAIGRGVFREGTGANFWRPKTGKHYIDILPFTAGPFMPTTGENPTKEGDVDFKVSLLVHTGVGAANASLLCIGQMYNRKCPVCDYRSSLPKGHEDWAPLRPKQQDVFAIVCYDTEEEIRKGPQIWLVPRFFFYKHIKELAVLPRGGGYVPYISPTKRGKIIAFTVNESSYQDKSTGKTAKGIEFIAHQFLDRDYDIPPEILAKVPAVDTLLYIPSYEEGYRILHGELPDSETVEKTGTDDIPDFKPPVSFGPKLSQDPIQEPPKQEPKKEPEKPKLNVGKKEEPKKEPEKKTNGDKCPFGHKFGVDIDQFTECSKCKIWAECAEESEKK